MTQGSTGQECSIAEEMRGHRCSLLVFRLAVIADIANFALVADDGQKYVLEGRLLLDVFDLRGWEQLLEFGERAVHDDPTPMEDPDPVGELLRLVQAVCRPQRGCALAHECRPG